MAKHRQRKGATVHPGSGSRWTAAGPGPNGKPDVLNQPGSKGATAAADQYIP